MRYFDNGDLEITRLFFSIFLEMFYVVIKFFHSDGDQKMSSVSRFYGANLPFEAIAVFLNTEIHD